MYGVTDVYVSVKTLSAPRSALIPQGCQLIP